ncbi:Flp family type IVb pilin [Alteribacter natronophilus]|uniref:Flp family type IVb pilin n=1 Tax=Alteribacter natronophilus TaxID=2583810 RepID=UPI00110D8EF1|nr:Flp family type IVb pilin [Alteribacter natronophilus]TMW70675.1 Flp family type IVb pilin [Alteribacter natronophilus]
MKNMFMNLWKDEKGQALSEYGVILGIILVAVVGLLVTFSSQLETVFQSIIDALSL